MWPLLALSILGVTVIFWRWWALRQATTGVAAFLRELLPRLVVRDIPGAIGVCERHRGPVRLTAFCVICAGERAGTRARGRARAPAFRSPVK